MQGSFYTVDANITNVSDVTYLGSGTKDGYVTVTFTYTGTTTTNGLAEILLRSLRRQSRTDSRPGSGLTDGANAWTGGSLQTTVDIGGSGATSIQLSPSAIIAGEISGLKFNDLNGNGIRDTGEAGLARLDHLPRQRQRRRARCRRGFHRYRHRWHLYILGHSRCRQIGYDNDPYIVREVNQVGWTKRLPIRHPF